ncbi:hypothetical protein TRL7639_02440 [Falsiruegeria litorea R37]|uniref:DUF3445 domain-containing protein n=1 Tax=Falsiruegeria litorea R37 TaxID=1200284 RepID=A0A1Y5SP81_9RHOB|nr:DUF3445 domain-containing protein [Falsiruegeria litorea]SLN45232.1 hypothetical protein TRL7639_02440 [Falsiruegeria litorea R37]
MKEILQTSIPYDFQTAKALPGIAPIGDEAWLHQDEAFAGQMAYRDELITRKRDKVVAIDEAAVPAARELLDEVLAQIYPGQTNQVLRADGVRVPLDRDNPLGTLGRIVQEDFCILQKQGDEHVLTGAVLCFPASWTLSEKFMRPLIGIHDTVDSYDAGIAKRVQRLFDGVKAERPMWRFNALWYVDPDLHQPRSIHDRRKHPDPANASYFRSERQCILRLPQTEAVVFSIHTYILAKSHVPNDESPVTR